MITPPPSHNTQTSHMHTNTPQPWSKPQMAVNRLLWAGLDESVSLDSQVFLPSGRLLVYFSTHQHLYVPSLSFCSDKEQIRAIDHVKRKMNYSAAGAKLDPKFQNFKIWYWSWWTESISHNISLACLAQDIADLLMPSNSCPSENQE